MCGAGRAARAPYPRGGDRRSGSARLEGAAAFLLAKVEETPASRSRRAAGAAERARPWSGPARCGGSSIAMGSALKKTAHAAEQEQQLPDVDANKRAGWPGSKANPISIPADWCSSMRPAPRPRWPVCGAARSVANAAVPRPHGHWKTTTFTAGLRPGWPDRADAPPWRNGVAFLAYVEQVLVPTLVGG